MDIGRDIIVVGASAGGVEALQVLCKTLPRDLGAAVCIALHLPPDAVSILPEILTTAGRLPAAQALDNEPIVYGRIYLAPPDRHLLVMRGFTRVVRGPRENRHRPSIDVLFRSAAIAYGARVTGVLLSGADDDGAAGAAAIDEGGGEVIVQDPLEAAFPMMPQSALRRVASARAFRLEDIGAEVTRLSAQPVSAGNPHPPASLTREVALQSHFERGEKAGTEMLGKPSVYGCPECGGTLWEMENGNDWRFRCRVGHAYSPESLMAEQTENTESALWSAVRALEENAAVSRRLASRVGILGEHYLERARSREQDAAIIRKLLLAE
jgi:two-component system chemotaxis response regulator CheB